MILFERQIFRVLTFGTKTPRRQSRLDLHSMTMVGLHILAVLNP